ncbi:hypothetical protein M413DRAFT_17851 [Hebeloma cylindrosporum]|uniref:Protein kinase domain-containing protein n=1 Tax=Hebeloma cylindrosporum TaxID=76867 RepID=A0A0C2Y565_HEBCY|nr:hypothetical protein M413DRAFT_17851 [Hebeloma cylindrosporum h7]
MSMKLHDFLVEHAKFPFPHPNEDRTAGTNDIFQFEVAVLEREWKARHAVRDNTLVQKLCQALEDILGTIPLAAGAENYLLASFLPQLGFIFFFRTLLNRGIFKATRRCLGEYGPYRFKTAKEQSVKGGSSKVDYEALVNDESKVLLELLPPRCIELKWVSSQCLVPKILSEAALYLGQRHMKWLFISCHDYWIVCRLVRHDYHPYLAYSPEITIKDSSEPFRAFLGAILSVVKDVLVERSAYSSDMELDISQEEEHKNPLPGDVIDDDLAAYQGSSGGRAITSQPVNHSREDGNTESELMVTSSSPNSPKYFQVWVHLYSLSNNTLALPQCAENSNQRLWLTRFVSSGSSGNVWECRFVVEVLRPSDAGSRQRLRNEFKGYLALEKAYHTGQLPDRIAPGCYGAFKGNRVDVLIHDLCEGVLNQWGELSAPERSQVYRLVQALHRIGIVHGDLEPRNIVRIRGGDFCLIDFSEKRHICWKDDSPLNKV